MILLACGDSTQPKTSADERQKPGPHAEEMHHHGAHAGMGGHQHRFDDAAKWSKVFDDPARDAWQKPARVVEVMGIAPGMTVADIGAGTGYFEPYLSRAVGPSGKVIAEDLEPDMVKWLGERAKRESLANVEARKGEANDPMLAHESVDRVLIVDTWHHIADRKAFSSKLFDAVKPGGAVFIVDFTMESPHGPPKHARVLPQAVVDELAATGWSAELVADAGLPNQYVVRGNKR